MSSDEVMLLSDNDCLWIRADDAEDPSGTLSEYIALPAAKHAALMRFVRRVAEITPNEAVLEGLHLVGRLKREALEALNEPAPERRGEAPRA